MDVDWHSALSIEFLQIFDHFMFPPGCIYECLKMLKELGLDSLPLMF